MGSGLDLDFDDWLDVVGWVNRLDDLFSTGQDHSGYILLGKLSAKVNAMDARLRESESEELRQAEVDRANGAVINDVLATIGSEGSE